MFITVRFSPPSDQQKDSFEVFNSDCYICLLEKTIREKCECSESDDLVLADDSCNLVPITKLALKDALKNASSLFRERGRYILLSTETTSKGKLRYRCHLSSQFIEDELEEKMSALTNPDSLPKKGRSSSLRTSSIPKKRARTKKSSIT